MKKVFRKKLVFSGNTAWGMYNFRGKLMRYFVEKGYNVSVLAPDDPVFSNKLRELGCNVIDIKIQSKGMNPFADVMLIWNYYKIFKRERPDVSITYTIKPNIYASIAARKVGIPFLPVTTGLGYIFLHNNLVSKIAKNLYKFAFSKASQVWFLNTDDMRIFNESALISENKVRLLHGEGIDTSYLPCVPLASAGQTVKFLLIGRMIADKGLYEYAEAAKIVKKHYPQTEFHLLGPLWPENPAAVSEQQLKAWNEEGYVKYLGATDDVRQCIKNVDVVVLPSSYREGVPFTLMEGASMCRPLIATDIPGCRDVVIDGKTGFLCEVKNPQSLADAMIKMIKLSPDQRTAMGKAGRAYMEQEFDIKHIIQQYEKVIEEMCE